MSQRPRHGVPSHFPVNFICCRLGMFLRAYPDVTDFDICTQLHLALQTASQWHDVYDGFDYKACYWFIVDYPECGPALDAEDPLD